MFYYGRIDAQVKINGVRIELGEVEAALGQWVQSENLRFHEQPVAAKVNDQLVAFFVPTDDVRSRCTEPTFMLQEQAAAAKDFLSGVVSRVGVPQLFVLIPEIPRGGTGKVNRKALTLPKGTTSAAMNTKDKHQGDYGSRSSHRLEDNVQARKLRSICASIVNRPDSDISWEGNLAEGTGFDSIGAARLLMELTRPATVKALGFSRRPTMGDLLTSPNIGTLFDILWSAESASSSSEEEVYMQVPENLSVPRVEDPDYLPPVTGRSLGESSVAEGSEERIKSLLEHFIFHCSSVDCREES